MEEESTNFISVSNVAKLITIEIKRKLKFMMILTRKQLCNDSIWIRKNLCWLSYLENCWCQYYFITQNNFKYGKDSYVGKETFSSRGIKEAKRSYYSIRFHWIIDYTHMQILQLPIQVSNRFWRTPVSVLCPRKREVGWFDYMWYLKVL